MAGHGDALGSRHQDRTLVRCPAGRHKECFYQKHHTGSLPASIHAVKVPEKRKSAQDVTIDDRQGLLALIQMGAVELHRWGARNGAPVSVPVSWQQVQQAIAPDAFTIEDLPGRLKRQKKDPWAEYFTVKQALTVAMMKDVAGRGRGA